MKDRERELLRILADSVRVMTLEQVARIWWSESRWGRHRARRRLNELASRGFVHVRVALSRPIQILSTPILTWNPDCSSPDFESLTRQLHLRASANARRVTITYAAQRTVVMFGTGKMPTVKLTQLTHDLHVTEIYLYYRRQDASALWVSEDRLPRDWPLRERPDALLRDPHGHIVRALEFGGDYTRERLTELHAGFARLELAYEIW